MSEIDSVHAIEQLLGEQLAYYRARAPEYLRSALVPLQSSEAAALRHDIGAVFDAHFRGDVLELACGPGTWTAMLADRARSLTAVRRSAGDACARRRGGAWRQRALRPV